MKTKFYPGNVFFCRKLFTAISPALFLCFLFIVSSFTTHAQVAHHKKKHTAVNTKKQQASLSTIRKSTNVIWFEKNEGQFADEKIQYGFRTSFGIIGVFNNKLRMVARQSEKEKTTGHQVVDISFPGSLNNWNIVPGERSTVEGSYNTTSGINIAPAIYTEITLKEVYPGTDLRLYSGSNGSLEFDWLLTKAAGYQNIRMKFEGQNSLKVDKKGNLLVDLEHDDIKIVIPETYQVINGKKKLLPAGMQLQADKKTVSYNIKGNLNLHEPLVIDPVMSWSTYMHNNTKTFDEYLYAVAANQNDVIYACGLTNEPMSSAYLSGVAPGYSGTYTHALNSDGKKQTAILYRLNAGGTEIISWTYTGQTANVPVAMGIFPNSRVLVVYQNDTVQIFSANLATRHYNGVINAANVASKITSYQSVAIYDNNTFYLGGVAGNYLPRSVIPANAPDTSYSNGEGVILRVTNAMGTPDATWGTYVGGTSRERFTAIALTPNKSKLVFGVHTEGTGSGYPSLVNAVDNTISGNELLVGVLNMPAPTSFAVFSYLGGSANEGSASTISSAALVAADNNYFYVAGNTLSTSLPGISGAAQTAHGANSRFSDQFVSRIPLNGSAGSGFRTTFSGGNDVDLVGGLVIDSRTSDVLLFGTTVSSNFPVYSPNPVSPYYQATHGPFEFGTRDITYTIFSNDLSVRKYSTYIGGNYDDYLGSTGKLEGTGHFQYSNVSGLTYIGTTIHSDQTSMPGQWMSSVPGFDKMIPAATRSKDSHYIFAINPNTSDHGDAPESYDGTSNPASSAVSSGEIRIGLTVDAEPKPNPTDQANGDDLQNYGSADDEDGVVTPPSMYMFATAYTIPVAVYNNTGGNLWLCGWIDTDGNGVFNNYEYTRTRVPSSSAMQTIVLGFSGLPPFMPVSGKTYLRLRLSTVNLTAANARGAFGKGEVEDYIVPQAVILPVTIERFTATLQNENVLLNWVMSNETDMSSYEAEYSTDDRTFSPIGSRLVDNNGQYNLVHITPQEGNNYYRIKMIGRDGSFTYSPTRKVILKNNRNITIQPNPAKDMINIYLNETGILQAVTITVMAADGKVVAKRQLAMANRVETIDAGNLAKGYYFVRIETASQTAIKTVQVTH
jgi:hypothetical protein